MVALRISAHLKPRSFSEFAFVLEQEIHPSLKKIKGFRGHIVFVLLGASQAVAISLWNEKENDRARKEATSKVVPTLGKLAQGAPKIKACEFLDRARVNPDLLQLMAGLAAVNGQLQIFEVSRFVFQHFTMESLV
ncbi:MAG TPA: hypothetical protein VKV95_07290 [Terriglobia bacterium]|nr:hypothetical protein [Terriglobia bacterium]